MIWDYLGTKQDYLDVAHFIVISQKSKCNINWDLMHSFHPAAKLLVQSVVQKKNQFKNLIKDD